MSGQGLTPQFQPPQGYAWNPNLHLPGQQPFIPIAAVPQVAPQPVQLAVAAPAPVQQPLQPQQIQQPQPVDSLVAALAKHGITLGQGDTAEGVLDRLVDLAYSLDEENQKLRAGTQPAQPVAQVSSQVQVPIQPASPQAVSPAGVQSNPADQMFLQMGLQTGLITTANGMYVTEDARLMDVVAKQNHLEQSRRESLRSLADKSDRLVTIDVLKAYDERLAKQQEVIDRQQQWIQQQSERDLLLQYQMRHPEQFLARDSAGNTIVENGLPKPSPVAGVFAQKYQELGKLGITDPDARMNLAMELARSQSQAQQVQPVQQVATSQPTQAPVSQPGVPGAPVGLPLNLSAPGFHQVQQPAPAQQQVILQPQYQQPVVPQQPVQQPVAQQPTPEQRRESFLDAATNGTHVPVNRISGDGHSIVNASEMDQRNSFLDQYSEPDPVKFLLEAENAGLGSGSN